MFVENINTMRTIFFYLVVLLCLLIGIPSVNAQRIDENGEITLWYKGGARKFCLHDIVSFEEKERFTYVEYVSQSSKMLLKSPVQNSIALIYSSLEKNKWPFLKISSKRVLNGEHITQYPYYEDKTLKVSTYFGEYNVVQKYKREICEFLDKEPPMNIGNEYYAQVGEIITMMRIVENYNPKELAFVDLYLELQNEEVTNGNRLSFIVWVLKKYSPSIEEGPSTQLEIAIEIAFENMAKHYIKELEEVNRTFAEYLRENIALKLELENIEAYQEDIGAHQNEDPTDLELYTAFLEAWAESLKSRYPSYGAVNEFSKLKAEKGLITPEFRPGIIPPGAIKEPGIKLPLPRGIRLPVI